MNAALFFLLVFIASGFIAAAVAIKLNWERVKNWLEGGDF